MSIPEKSNRKVKTTKGKDVAFGHIKCEDLRRRWRWLFMCGTGTSELKVARDTGCAG